jgi:hypothetical protein
VQFRELDLFGKLTLRSRLVRTSNAYVFRDPLPCAQGLERSRGGQAVGGVSLGLSSESENPPGTLNQDFSYLSKSTPDPKSSLEQALSRLKNAMSAKEGSLPQ